MTTATRRASIAMIVVLGACGGSGTPSDAARSGVRGVVTAGPQCSVEVSGSPCPDVPWQGTVRASTVGGDVAGETRAAADGRFELVLAPGFYFVTAVTDSGRLPTASPLDVSVTEGHWVEVALSVDTGIR